jgi:hypothetical protein
VAWSAVASSVKSQASAAARAGLHASDPKAAQLQAQIYHHALAHGFSRGYLVSAGVLALILVITVFMMRVNRAELSGAEATPSEDASPPPPVLSGPGARRPRSPAAATPASRGS